MNTNFNEDTTFKMMDEAMNFYIKKDCRKKPEKHPADDFFDKAFSIHKTLITVANIAGIILGICIIVAGAYFSVNDLPAVLVAFLTRPVIVDSFANMGCSPFDIVYVIKTVSILVGLITTTVCFFQLILLRKVNKVFKS